MHLLLTLASDINDTNQSAYSSAATSSFITYLLVAIGMWPMLKKAGRPGWGGFVPIYNIYLQIKLAGRSGLLLLLYVVPIVNFVVAIVVAIGIARAFGKDGLYGFFLLFLLQPVGYLILGFGSAQYTEIHR
jgi:nitrate reductase NapE component